MKAREKMVHVKKCPLGKRRKQSTEFFIYGKPQIYCYGYVNHMTDDLIDVCKNCADHVNKAQNDLEVYRQEELKDG